MVATAHKSRVTGDGGLSLGLFPLARVGRLLNQLSSNVTTTRIKQICTNINSTVIPPSPSSLAPPAQTSEPQPLTISTQFTSPASIDLLATPASQCSNVSLTPNDPTPTIRNRSIFFKTDVPEENNTVISQISGRTIIPPPLSPFLPKRSLFSTSPVLTPTLNTKDTEKKQRELELPDKVLFHYLELDNLSKNNIDKKMEKVSSLSSTLLASIVKYAIHLIQTTAAVVGTAPIKEPTIEIKNMTKALSVSSSLDWEQHLPIEYVKQMNRLSQKKTKFLQDKVNRIAPKLNLEETVQYAEEEITLEFNQNFNSEDNSSISTNVSQRSPATQISVVVETVIEEDSNQAGLNNDNAPTAAAGGGGGGVPPPGDEGGTVILNGSSLKANKDSSKLSELSAIVNALRKQHQLHRQDQEKHRKRSSYSNKRCPATQILERLRCTRKCPSRKRPIFLSYR